MKTLKDIRVTKEAEKKYDSNHGMAVYGGEKTQLVLKQELKLEAVKWYHRSDADKHKFIVEFFNLTEEEIKEGSRLEAKDGKN